MIQEGDIFRQILADERLTRAIDTIPYWSTAASGELIDGEATDHLLGANGVMFRLSTYPDLSHLTCFAKAPNYLELERGRAGIEDLQHFMIVDFPQLFYDLDGVLDEQALYRENSYISFTSRENEDDTFTFQVQSEADRANLFQTYSELNRRNTKMVSISAARGYEQDRKRCGLSVVYAREKDQPDEIWLSLPMNEFGINGWTKRASAWALRNHVNAGNIPDLYLAADELSGTIRQVTARVLNSQRQ